MTQDDMKRAVAEAAIQYVQEDISIIGVGTGSTVNYFIDALAAIKQNIEGAVASSEATAKRLQAAGIRVFDLNSVGPVLLYVDGADEANHHRQLIKGGGGALTREKILASAAKKFVCMIDETKYVDVLGQFPLAVEVIPMARGYVARELVKLGGDPIYREGFITDNGNIILDVQYLSMLEPMKLESELNNIVGVVCHGLFATRTADTLLISTQTGIQTV